MNNLCHFKISNKRSKNQFSNFDFYYSATKKIIQKVERMDSQVETKVHADMKQIIDELIAKKKVLNQTAKQTQATGILIIPKRPNRFERCLESKRLFGLRGLLIVFF
jgi:hypothetical protein